ncbi:MAG TPA: ABC transporter permease [Gaiellaceae bacterium]|jgi:ribose transport system ATP-binding protein|nr:ABC transporter permease [Gaiellaceae bacterium]
MTANFRGWMPLALMTTLIVGLGAYAATHESAFLTKYNIGNLLLTTLPLALVAIGQTNALLVGGFDVSVAALMTMCVVTASFTLQPQSSWPTLLLGALALVGVGVATGVFNATLIRVLRLPSIIATLGTLSILEGASLLLRDHPEGFINNDVIDALNTSWDFVPLAFIGVVVLAVLADVWLYGTRTGLAMRAVGLDETSSRRLGMRTGRTVFLAFVLCSAMASVAGFYSAAQVQIGSPIIGNYALESIAAAVLGGASLAGGKGSFVGTLLAALFLTEIGNVLPLFQQPTEYAQMTIGGLILLALIVYQAPELVARFRSNWQGVGRLRTRQGEAPAA